MESLSHFYFPWLIFLSMQSLSLVSCVPNFESEIIHSQDNLAINNGNLIQKVGAGNADRKLNEENTGHPPSTFHDNENNYHRKSLSLSERANITYSKVLPCLNEAWIMDKWISKGNWTFPTDAEEHFKHLNAKAAAFRIAPIHHYAGYGGPWLENLFIYNYMNKPLSFFNGLIPIFIQWIDTDIKSKSDAVRINEFLKSELRPNVLYLAISQGDIGLGQAGTDNPNILVMSAGGYGHIPLPLIRGEIALQDEPGNFSQEIGFLGNMATGSRKKILDTLQQSLTNNKLSYLFAQKHDWMEEMSRSKINVAPRGYGRNSFRFTESIQMGRIPFFVYDDIPWIPYEGTDLSIHTYGFSGGFSSVCNHTKIEDTVQLITKMTNETYYSKIDHLIKIRKYFTYAGLFEEIDMFLQDPFGPDGGHLRCIKHPRNERCCDQTNY